MVMFDSLNKHMLPAYGCDWVKAPNFERLYKNSIAFDRCYIGSAPCMPARRELHTGRYNFLHRRWGPLEPFDDSMPELLKNNGIHSHLVSDHYHYWEDGGATYHNRYSTWELCRGQEGDPWKGDLRELCVPEHIGGRKGSWGKQDWINRKYIKSEEGYPLTRTFNKGLEFIETNHNEDNWFLQIEAFDPHEPFMVPEKYLELYPEDYKGPHFDWPLYNAVTETPEQVQHLKNQYAALLSMCDHNLGKVLDAFDKHDMWEDTMLIVNTDHGFLLSDHGWWGKNVQPFFNEVANIPLFIWDPRSQRKNEHCNCLVQTIDIAPTLLDYFNIEIPENMQGKSLKDTISSNKEIRDAALFGIHGAFVNCTDGNYVYMRAFEEKKQNELYNYTLMPTIMRSFISLDELRTVELSEPFKFTKGCRVMKIRRIPETTGDTFNTMLFDLKTDPKQEKPIHDLEIEEIMIKHMIQLMKENDAPAEQYTRLGYLKI